jgi:hypothetical protein
VKYGYARVSTSEQDHAGQIDALTAAGAVKVFSEKMSGVRADRPNLARAIAALDQGDVLAVTRIDRLARSSRDLLNIVYEIEARGDVRVALRAMGQHEQSHGICNAHYAFGFRAARPGVHPGQDERGQGARQSERPKVWARAETQRAADRACARSAARGAGHA